MPQRSLYLGIWAGVTVLALLALISAYQAHYENGWLLICRIICVFGGFCGIIGVADLAQQLKLRLTIGVMLVSLICSFAITWYLHQGADTVTLVLSTLGTATVLACIFCLLRNANLNPNRLTSFYTEH